MSEFLPLKRYFNPARSTVLFTWILNYLGDALEWEDTPLGTDGELACEYYYRSYKKPISTMVNDLYENYDPDDESQVDPISFISSIITNRFGRNWVNLYKTYFNTTYKPLDNVDI